MKAMRRGLVQSESSSSRLLSSIACRLTPTLPDPDQHSALPHGQASHYHDRTPAYGVGSVLDKSGGAAPACRRRLLEVGGSEHVRVLADRAMGYHRLRARHTTGSEDAFLARLAIGLRLRGPPSQAFRPYGALRFVHPHYAPGADVAGSPRGLDRGLVERRASSIARGWGRGSGERPVGGPADPREAPRDGGGGARVGADRDGADVVPGDDRGARLRVLSEPICLDLRPRWESTERMSASIGSGWLASCSTCVAAIAAGCRDDLCMPGSDHGARGGNDRKRGRHGVRRLGHLAPLGRWMLDVGRLQRWRVHHEHGSLLRVGERVVRGHLLRAGIGLPLRGMRRPRCGVREQHRLRSEPVPRDEPRPCRRRHRPLA